MGRSRPAPNGRPRATVAGTARRRVAALVAAGLIALASGCGTTGSTAGGTSTGATSAPSSTSSTTEPTTTESTTTTSPPPTAVPRPAGALAIGDGVFLPVPAQWKWRRTDARHVVLDHGDEELEVQTASEGPSTDPRQVIDDYASSVAKNLSPVSFSRAVRTPVTADIQTVRYDFTYVGLATSDYSWGTVTIFVRADGLIASYDISAPLAFGRDAASAPNGEDQFIDSLTAAPPVGTVGHLLAAPSYPIVDPVEPETVEGTIGLVVADGWKVSDRSAGALSLEKDQEILNLRVDHGVAHVGAELADYQQTIRNTYSDVKFQDPVAAASAGGYTTTAGVVQESIGFTAFYDSSANAAGVGGRITAYFRPDGIAVISSTALLTGQESLIDTAFMELSLSFSL